MQETFVLQFVLGLTKNIASLPGLLLTTELDAFEIKKKRSVVATPILFILADNEVMNKILDEFALRQDRTIDPLSV